MEKYSLVSWDELKTVRITCKNCNTSFEATIGDGQSRLTDRDSCPVCNNSFLLSLGDGNYENMLKRLATVSRGLNALKKSFSLEFVVKDEQPPQA